MANDTDPYISDSDDTLILTNADQQLHQRLTGGAAVEEIATALRNAAFELDQDDSITITTAESLAITDAESYTRGFELLDEVGALETRIATHYARFDKPLNYLIGIVRKLKGPQVNQVTPIKQALAKRLGTWKYEQDRLDEQRREAEQRARDLAAQASQAAKAAVLDRIADAETDPALQASFRASADQTRSVEVKAPPVETTKTVPSVSRGYTRVPMVCEFVDLKELLKAYVEGRCFLDEEAITKGLQSSMNKQAQSLGANLSKAYPGTKAVPVPSAVRRKS